VSEFAGRFRRKIESDKASKPKTVAYYTNEIKNLLRFERLRDARLDEVNRELVSGFIQWRSIQKRSGGRTIRVGSVNRALEVLRRMLKLAFEWHISSSAPKITRLPGEKPRDRVITHEDKQLYLAAAPQPLRDIATILVDAGLRPEEAFRLRWENVHLGAGHVYIPTAKLHTLGAMCP